MLFIKYLFIFILFSVVGWILELVFRSLVTKKLVNPGFMTGCVVPLYGFGAVLLNILCNLFKPINSNYKIIIIFILAIIILSLLEFISGLILLKCFHLKLWDYSNSKFNYKGFVCLEFSFIWGFLALIFYLFVYPWLNDFALNFVNNNICLFVLGISTGVFLVDLCVSIQLLNRLIKYANSLKEIIDVEKLKLEARMKMRRKRFLNAIYPYVCTNKYLRERIKELKNNNK